MKLAKNSARICLCRFMSISLNRMSMPLPHLPGIFRKRHCLKNSRNFRSYSKSIFLQPKDHLNVNLQIKMSIKLRGQKTKKHLFQLVSTNCCCFYYKISCQLRPKRSLLLISSRNSSLKFMNSLQHKSFKLNQLSLKSKRNSQHLTLNLNRLNSKILFIQRRC